MATSIKQVIEGIRSLLLYPPFGRVPNHLILARLEDRLAYYLTALNITNENWFLIRYPLTITPAQSEFPLDVAGRPVLCVTVDDSDPNHVEREIEIVTVQDRDKYYIGTMQGMSNATMPHVATSFTVFYDQDRGERMVRVTPQHTQQANYLLWMQPETFAPPRLADNYPLLNNFISLTKTDVALSLLPALMDDDGGNMAKISAMRDQLGAEFQRYDTQFMLYKQIAVNEQSGPRRGWAEESDSYLGW